VNRRIQFRRGGNLPASMFKGKETHPINGASYEPGEGRKNEDYGTMETGEASREKDSDSYYGGRKVIFAFGLPMKNSWSGHPKKWEKQGKGGT